VNLRSQTRIPEVCRGIPGLAWDRGFDPVLRCNTQTTKPGRNIHAQVIEVERKGNYRSRGGRLFESTKRAWFRNSSTGELGGVLQGEHARSWVSTISIDYQRGDLAGQREYRTDSVTAARWQCWTARQRTAITIKEALSCRIEKRDLTRYPDQ